METNMLIELAKLQSEANKKGFVITSVRPGNFFPKVGVPEIDDMLNRPREFYLIGINVNYGTQKNDYKDIKKGE